MLLYTIKSQFVNVTNKQKKSGHQGCDYKESLLYEQDVKDYKESCCVSASSSSSLALAFKFCSGCKLPGMCRSAGTT